MWMPTVAYYTLFIKPGSSAGRWLAHHPPTHAFTVLQAPFWILFLFQHAEKNITSAFRNEQSTSVKVKTCQARVQCLCFFTQSQLIFHPTWQIYSKLFLEGSLFRPTSCSISSRSWKLSFPKAKFSAVYSSYSTCLQLSCVLACGVMEDPLNPWDHGSILTFWAFFNHLIVLFRHLREVSWFVSKTLYSLFYHVEVTNSSPRGLSVLPATAGYTFILDLTFFLYGRTDDPAGLWPSRTGSGHPENKHKYMLVCCDALH